MTQQRKYSIKVDTCQTTDGVTQVSFSNATYTLPTDSGLATRVRLQFHDNVSPDNDSGYTVVNSLFKNVSGTVTKIGSDDVQTGSKADAPVNTVAYLYAISSQTITFKVIGVASTTINYIVWLEFWAL